MLRRLIQAGLFILLFIACNNSFSQVKWSANPFEQKVFVENKGQYDLKEKAGAPDILFGATLEGLDYYFTRSSIWIKHRKQVKRTPDEIEALEKQLRKTRAAEEKEGKEKEEWLTWRMEEEFYKIDFIGSTTSAIQPESLAEGKHSFVIKDEKFSAARSGKPSLSVSAQAFKKLIYKDLYPGIDMEFYFPEDKEGFKYNFIVHPGADVSQIKIRFPLMKKMDIDSAGNLNTESVFGKFVDHAPQSFYAKDHQPVASAFELNKNIMSFYFPGGYSPTSSIIIDPWTTVVPSFSGTWTENTGTVHHNTSSKAYDVDWDFAGNCYVMGGQYTYNILKYNSAGTLLWTSVFAEYNSYTSGTSPYGDFVVDKKSQSVYWCEGFNPSDGARVHKLEPTAGLEIAVYNPAASGVRADEMWRMALNTCTNQIVIGEGGTSTPSGQVCYMDTTLTKMTNAIIKPPIANVDVDTWGLALDASGHGYIVWHTPAWFTNYDPALDNGLARFPLPSILPYDYLVPTGHKLGELVSSRYKTVTMGAVATAIEGNGINGMAVNYKHLFTYDGFKLKRWDPPTGAATGNLDVNIMASTDSSNSHVYSYYLGNANQYYTVVRWSGITLDDCDHLFVGSKKQVNQYDGNNLSAVPVSVFPMPDSVYDVNLDTVRNILYTCGRGFVNATQLNLQPCPPTETITATQPLTCSAQGSATVTVTGNAPPYTYSWSNGQTGSAVNLSSGTYTVTVQDAKLCFPHIITDVITIIAPPGAVTATVSTTNVKCSGASDGTSVINASGGSMPYTYSWLPSISTGNSITGLGPGSYTATVTDGVGCSNTQALLITEPPPLTTTVSSAPANCSNTNGSASVDASGGTPIITGTPYTYNWNPAGQSTQSISNLSAGDYSVTVTDGNGCTATNTITLTSIGNVIAQAGPSTTLCTGQTTTLAATGGTDYLWSDGNTSTTIIISPASSGTSTYSVVVSTGLCKDTAFVNVTVSPPPVANTTSETICSGQIATLNASGGVNYNWSNGNTTSAINVSPNTTSSYSVIVSVGNCRDTAYTAVVVNPSPTVTISGNTTLCKGDMATLTATGSNNYIWSSASTDAVINVSPSITTTYSVTTTNANCSSAASITVFVAPVPTANALPAIICEGQTTTLTATGGGTYLWDTGETTTSITPAPSQTQLIQ